jgi:chaperonin GroES
MAKKKKTEIKPTAGYLLLQPLGAQEKTAAGIYLPESASEKPQKGKVLSVGADEVTDSGKTKKSPAKKGDIVIYKKWGGSEVTVDGEEYLFAKFEDVLAIVN